MKPVDNLWTTLPKRAQLIHKLEMYLTSRLRCHRLKRAAVADSSQERMQLTPLLCLILGSLLIQTIPAQAKEISTDHLKLYAHSRIVSWKEFQCFNHIITKESRWNYKARNGSHYGLGQMRNIKYKHLDAYTQIDWTIRYITNRYKTPCRAWSFHERKGYF